MNRNRFNPQIWEQPRPVHPIPPFVNQGPNFFHQNFQNAQNNFGRNNNFPPLQNPHDQLPSGINTGNPPPNFRKYINNRRPGPACSRNNNFQSNKQWQKDNRRENFNNNRDSQQPFEPFESLGGSYNNNNNRPLPPPEERPPSPPENDVPKFKSLVEHLKAVHNSCQGPADPAYAKNATEASKKLLTQLKTMDKDGVKDLINNPKQPYKKKVLNIQAREKLREQMRKKLKKLGNESDGSSYQFEPDECIDYERIPDTLLAQIGKTMDVDLDGLDDMDVDLSESMIGMEDKDIEVVKQNLGNDFLMGSEMLLMNGFSLLAETDAEAGLDESIPKIPPLPADRPPSPPPEPVPAPTLDKAVFSSLNKSWSPIKQTPRGNFNDDEWDIESAKNPDPPNVNPPSVSSVKKPVESTVVEITEKKVVDDEWDKSGGAEEKAEKATGAEETKPEPESGQRANETYGEYRRRLIAESLPPTRDIKDDEWDVAKNTPSFSQNNKRQQKNFNQNQRRGDWNDNDNRRPGPQNRNNDNWISNNRNNNNNNRNDSRQEQNSRKSRKEMNRGRDRKENNFRNASRDTNNSYDSRQQEDVKDGHNYRFQNETNTQEPIIDRLNTILNPKPLQFKGSFNKRSNHGRRSRSRNFTPVNTSVERDFDESLIVPVNDVRPCYYMLKKVMEIDADIAKMHDKIHGIDKVISNLQSERLTHQKTFTRLQHDRKVLFDNLMKRAISESGETNRKEKSASKERVVVSAAVSSKSQMEKKLQNIVDQKKRKIEDPPEEVRKKKPALEVMETTSAAEKAAQRQKEREDEERKHRIQEKKRLRLLRKEREEHEKLRNEEKIKLEAAAIKQEPREKPPKPQKAKEIRKILFKQSEILQVENYNRKDLSVNLQKVAISQSFVDRFKSNGSVEIDVDDWKKWCKSEKREVKVDKVEKVEKEKSPDLTAEPILVPEMMEDPLAMDDNTMNPPTPGSNLTTSDENSMLVEITTEQDYSEWTGNFNAHEKPIVHLQNIKGKYIVAASEDGKVYKFHINDGKLACVFSKHKEICNSFLYDDSGSIYTVSSDGFIHKIKFKTFQLIASENFHEALQVIEKSKTGIFVGTKSGKIFKLNPDLTEHEKNPICDLGSLILCLRAAKEGPRNILLISSRANAIQVRDAGTGLLLRTLSDDLANVSIYDMLIDGSTIYCGSNRHEIFSVDFTTGALLKSRPCGAGAICVRLYKNYLIAACYDGNIYIFNTNNEEDAVNICGPSNMLLAMDLWDNKIIASTKDKMLKIQTIPT